MMMVFLLLFNIFIIALLLKVQNSRKLLFYHFCLLDLFSSRKFK